MKLLSLLAILLSVNSFAASALSESQAYQLNRMSRLFSLASVGTQLLNAVQSGVKGSYKYSRDGGAVGTINLKDHEGKVVTLPSGAIVVDCLIDVVTQPTSGGSATVATNIASTGDLKTATAVGSLTVGRYDCTPAGAAANTIKLTSQKNMSITVAVAALTAGEINVWLEYVLSN